MVSGVFQADLQAVKFISYTVTKVSNIATTSHCSYSDLSKNSFMQYIKILKPTNACPEDNFVNLILILYRLNIL